MDTNKLLNTPGISFFQLIVFLVLVPGILMGQEVSEIINKTDSEGRKHGKWIKMNSQGDVVYKGHFEHGKPVDTFRYFYSPEKIKAEIVHAKEDKVTYATLYFKNGEKKAHGKYVRQKRDSVWTFYSNDGRKVSEKSFENGKQDGLSKYYYNSGQLLKEIIFEEGVKNGKEVFYYRNGSLDKKQHYKEGKLHGPFMVFYPEGDTMTSGSYFNDVKKGKWKYFNKEGKLERERIYKEGELIKEKSFSDSTSSDENS